MAEPLDDHVVDVLSSRVLPARNAWGRRRGRSPAATPVRGADAEPPPRPRRSVGCTPRDRATTPIGSAGHESNAAVAAGPAARATRHCCTTGSGGFYSARAAQVAGLHADPGRAERRVRRPSHDRISGGRHKVFGNRDLAVIPQTSTIGSHLPRAVGLAFAARPAARGPAPRFPRTPSSCAASATPRPTTRQPSAPSTPRGYCVHRGMPMPVLFVCEDNGIGISTRSPEGWIRAVSLDAPRHRLPGGRRRRPRAAPPR